MRLPCWLLRRHEYAPIVDQATIRNANTGAVIPRCLYCRRTNGYPPLLRVPCWWRGHSYRFYEDLLGGGVRWKCYRCGRKQTAG